MAVKLIVAVDNGNAIGWSDGRLPWHIPYDLHRFKQLTTGHTVVMGHKTYQSLNMPDGLPNRRNIVLTRRGRDKKGKLGNVDVIPSLHWIGEAQRRSTVNDTWIIGGASVYAEALDEQMVDELHVTFVHENSGADVKLPFDLCAWKLFVLQQAKVGVQWEVIEHIRPTVINSPGIDILVFRKI